MNRFQFIQDHQHTWSVKRLCQVVDVARSSFYAWVSSAPARVARGEADRLLAQRIRDIQDPAQGGDRAYGVPRVTAELNDGALEKDRLTISVLLVSWPFMVLPVFGFVGV